jgi:hypothetical protein
MQKNCTEFIAYENIMTSGAGSAAPAGTQAQPRGHRGDRARAVSGAPLEQALPLVKRALKVLADREVSPQLGLLKSTLLQLDSSFSERDYGVSSFRDFAERLEKQGFVTLKHSGRTTLVELADDGAGETVEAAPPPARATVPTASADVPGPDDDADEHGAPTNGNIAEGVALIRAILAEATAPPRWPMYVRQLKQFIRNARPDFDERRYGSILDLMRACQKDGFLRLERDRQGGLRVFASGPVKATNLPHGWSTLAGRGGETTEDVEPSIEAAPVIEEPVPTPPLVVEDDDNRGNRLRPGSGGRADASAAADVMAAAETAKPKRARKAAAGAAKRTRKAPLRDEDARPKARTRSRRSPS